MKQTAVLGFQWDFLGEVSRSALGIAAVAAIAGTLITRDAAFAVGCLVAIGIDVALVTVACHRGRSELQGGRVDAVAPSVMLVGRVVVKAGLLVLALLLPQILGFAGTVVGVLVFDVTLAFVGSALAILRVLGPGEGGGQRV